jgi:hypothetical protein
LLRELTAEVRQVEEARIMTSDNLIDTDRLPPEIDFAADAANLLRSWQQLVRALLELIGTDDRKCALWGIVSWYERVFECESYAAEPPIEGLDILIDELVHVNVSFEMHAELARARWAIRVAEELVKWRSCLRTSGAGPPSTGPATDRLELAIEGARRQIAVS